MKFYRRKAVREFRGKGKRQGWYRASAMKFESYKFRGRTQFGIWR